uniref:uncharacterized protein LOC122598628 n=1 Tax=Erigeron canadensis TaxID=72917 RepID=UPI001CB9D5FB|nr:uncharacterized protein LOC122598628 [Erigeron canadensis]
MILSVSQLCKTGVNFLFGRDGAIIMKDDEILGKGSVVGGVYMMTGTLNVNQGSTGEIDMLRETMGLMNVTDHHDEDNTPLARGWYLNTKTNLHMCNSREMFVDYHPVSDEEVNFAENDSVKVVGIGTVIVRFTTGKVLTLSNVCHAPKINKCLVSVTELDGNGFSMVFGGGEVIIKKSDEIMGKGYKQGGSYRLSIIEGPEPKSEGKVVHKEKISLFPDNDPYLSNLRRRGWYLSSRCTVHVCNSRDMFMDYQAWSGHEVILDNNEHVEVAGTGTVKLQFTTGKIMTLTNVFHMPTIKKCLLSLHKFPENGLSIYSGEGGEIIIKKDSKIIGKGYNEDGLLRLSVVDEH